VEADYNDVHSLKHALHGISVVVSTLAKEGLRDQFNLVTAAKEVGHIKRFIPSEFGLDFPDEISGPSEDALNIYTTKLEVRKALHEAKIPYTIIVNGIFMEYVFSPTMNVDLEARKVTIIGDGNFRLSTMHTDDIARFIPQVILDHHTLNKKVYLVGETHTFNELISILEETFKHPFTKDHMTVEALDEKIKSMPDDYSKFLAIVSKNCCDGLDEFSNPTNNPSNELYSHIFPMTVKEYLKTLIKE